MQTVPIPWRHAWERWLGTLLLLASIGVVLGLKLQLDTQSLNLNWDEFNYLNKIYQHQRGELTRVLQTFHVQLFAWLTSVKGHEVDQLLAARKALFGVRIATCLCIFALGRTLLGVNGALFAVLSGLSFSMLMRHGETFRFDPLLSLCSALAAALLVCLPGNRLAGAAAGAALALGGLISIKFAVFAPTLLAIVLAQWALGEVPRRRVATQALTCAIAAACSFGVLLLLHGLSVETESASSTRRFLGRAAGLMDAETILPQGKTLLSTLRWDVAFWGLLLVGTMTAYADALHLRGPARLRGLLLLALAAPLLTLVIYRNAFPYFYVTIIPLAAVLCGVLVDRLERWTRHTPLLFILGLALLVAPLHHGARRFFELNSDDHISIQRTILDGVHQIFPQPTPYIDRCGMVSSFPKVGPLMSTLMLKRIRDAKNPIFHEILLKHQPRMVLANLSSLQLNLDHRFAGGKEYRLLRSDFGLLRSNYIHHWGPVWVAGKKLGELKPEPTKFEILLHGPYTIEASKPVQIDGVEHAPGAVIELTLGRHRAWAQAPTRLTLRYGDHLLQPQLKFKGRIFQGLGFVSKPPKAKPIKTPKRR
ncbi:MAG: hypothetical protein OEZ06_09430 [Myxococcales bacterium]|nr:hypothetical protein [Myxococcales bacterium]